MDRTVCYSHLLRCSTACGVLVACVKHHGPYHHCAARRLDGYRKGVSTPHQQAPTLRRAETIAVPSHASTLTACSVTFLATPKVLPADGRTRSVCIAARGCCSTDIAQHMGMACKACSCHSATHRQPPLQHASHVRGSPRCCLCRRQRQRHGRRVFAV